jgi:DNA-binding response OmpR family regulator
MDSSRILIVEDDQSTCLVLAALLQETGYQVVATHDGEAALKRLERERFDLVITDIYLPRGDGMTILHTARCLDIAPAVIVQTGHGTLETAIIALREGAADYLLKPYTAEAMLNVVEQALAQRRAEQQQREAVAIISRELGRLRTSWGSALNAECDDADEQALRVGDLEIDRLRRVATLDDQPVHLTQIQFTLLACLAERAGETVEAATIVAATHGYRVSNEEAQLLLKSHIRNLRRKIDGRYLVNVRGLGYRLVAPIDRPLPSAVGAKAQYS